MKKRVVRAEEFEVVDAAGNVRLRIGLSADESPFFSMLDPGGQVRARFGLSVDGSAGLAIGDNGKVRDARLSSDGSPASRSAARTAASGRFGLAPRHLTLGMQVRGGDLHRSTAWPSKVPDDGSVRPVRKVR
jgi:hypothetical protein